MDTRKDHNQTEGGKTNGGSGLGDTLKRGREAFEGKYRQEIKDLLGLSELEIQATGARMDRDIHEALISVVMDASRRHVSKDELKRGIEALGEDAVLVARLVPSLDRLF